MEKNNKEAEQLKELYGILVHALEISRALGTTSKSATLTRMLGVIEFDLYKMGETLPE